MGQISVPGLGKDGGPGIVQIEGEEPNEQEQEAILNALSAVEDEPEPASGEEDDTALEAPEEDGGLFGISDETIRGAKRGAVRGFATGGMGGSLVGAVRGAAEGAEKEPGEGELGTPPEVRESVRQNVEELPGLMQLIAEIGPSALGAMAGGAMGIPGGPAGIMAGASAGGAAGEAIAQEFGIAPESDLNMALSALGPFAGPAFRLTGSGVGRVVGGISTRLPFASAARARNLLPKAVEEFESIGTKILSKQQGMMARDSGELYAAVRRSGVVVPQKAVTNTRNAMRELVKEMEPFKAFPETRQAMNAVRQLMDTISPIGRNTKGQFADPEISMDTLVRARQIIGKIIERTESSGGVRLGSAKKVFAAISDDLDKIANDPSLTGRAARLARAATQRAKLEFSVKDMERAVARFTKPTPEGSAKVIDVKGLQKWLQDTTNPKSKFYDKNFTNAMKDQIPEIKKRLSELAKISGKGGSGGPGSLVVRGRLTSTAVGAMAGIGFGGPMGGVVGALVGTNMPEMLTSILSTRGGSAFLEKAASLGKGTINVRAWATAGEIAARALGEKNESQQSAEPITQNQDFGKAL